MTIKSNLSTSENEENVEEIAYVANHKYVGRKKQKQLRQKKSYKAQNEPNLNISLEVFLNFLLETTIKLVAKFTQLFHHVMDELGGYQIIELMSSWCMQHPYIAICVMAGSCVAFLPFLLLVLFGLSTLLMALTGFLVLEGTLLTFLSMMLIGLVGALVLVLLFFGTVGGVSYFGFVNMYAWYGDIQRKKQSLENLIRNESDGTHLPSDNNAN